MDTRPRIGACLVVALCSAANIRPVDADNPLAQLTAYCWHAKRTISVYGEAGFIYADMKFHAGGVRRPYPDLRQPSQRCKLESVSYSAHA